MTPPRAVSVGGLVSRAHWVWHMSVGPQIICGRVGDCLSCGDFAELGALKRQGAVWRDLPCVLGGEIFRGGKIQVCFDDALVGHLRARGLYTRVCGFTGRGWFVTEGEFPIVAETESRSGLRV